MAGGFGLFPGRRSQSENQSENQPTPTGRQLSAAAAMLTPEALARTATVHSRALTDMNLYDDADSGSGADACGTSYDNCHAGLGGEAEARADASGYGGHAHAHAAGHGCGSSSFGASSCAGGVSGSGRSHGAVHAHAFVRYEGSPPRGGGDGGGSARSSSASAFNTPRPQQQYLGGSQGQGQGHHLAHAGSGGMGYQQSQSLSLGHPQSQSQSLSLGHPQSQSLSHQQSLSLQQGQSQGQPQGQSQLGYQQQGQLARAGSGGLPTMQHGGGGGGGNMLATFGAGGGGGGGSTLATLGAAGGGVGYGGYTGGGGNVAADGSVLVSLGASSGNKFIEDLLLAESSHNAMERYKALIRLMSHLRRRIACARLAQPTRPASWMESPEGADMLKQIVMVGECLARFGTAEFSERSNVSRAINTKDYATLLTQFLEAHGRLFTMEFICGLSPQALQDEVLTVRSLLQTRCDANSIMFGQLVKHVGLEGNGNGSAVVYNTSVVTASPTNIATASPKTWVHAASAAWAKASHKSRMQLGGAVAGAIGLIGAYMLSRRFGGGGGGGRSRREAELEEAAYGRQQQQQHGGGGGGGTLGLAERLLSSRTDAERTAVSALAACEAQLARAARNDELLAHDWRLGSVLRFGGGTHPPGYERIDARECSLGGYLQRLQAPGYAPSQYAYNAPLAPPAHYYAPAPPVPHPAPAAAADDDGHAAGGPATHAQAPHAQAPQPAQRDGGAAAAAATAWEDVLSKLQGVGGQAMRAQAPLPAQRDGRAAGAAVLAAQPQPGASTTGA